MKRSQCKLPCVYQIVNLVNGKRYIGSTAYFNHRQSSHAWRLNSGHHHSVALQRAWNKYGSESFECSVLEVVHDVSQLLSREQYWLERCTHEYNIAEDTTAFMRGKRHSESLKQVLSEMNSGSGNPFFGKKHTEKTREFLRQKVLAQIAEHGCGLRTGAVLSEETKRKISMANTGKPGPVMSEDGLRRLRESKLGENNPNFGKKLSAETRAKMSASKKVLYTSPEWKNRNR